MADQRMVDRAYWDPAMLTAAQQCGANAVNVYAWDHYLSDVNGYCGGFTPEVVAQIYAAGYDVHFTFCFRDGETPLDPATCVRILGVLGARPGAWVHNDIENGAMDSLAHDIDFTHGVQGAGFRSAPYGLATTLRLGYLQDVQGAWVASYVAPWDQPPPLVNVPNVGAWDFIGWQYSLNSPPAITVDVSVHSFPVAGSGGKGAPVATTPPPSTPFWVRTNAGHWHDAPNAPQGEAFAAGQTWKVVETVHDAGDDWWWYRPDLGAAGNSWWFVGRTPAGDADATVIPDPTPPAPPAPPTPPPASPDLTTIADQLRALAHQLDGK